MNDSPLSEETHAKHENEKKKEGSGGREREKEKLSIARGERVQEK